jgi:DNA modification methylase
VTQPPVQRINLSTLEQLARMADESRGLIVISTGFDPATKQARPAVGAWELTAEARRCVAECARVLRPGGFLFVYGLPRDNAVWGETLALLDSESSRLVFKYWIALDLDDAPANGFLQPSHLGLLLFLKARRTQKKPPALELDTETVRVPHAYCSVCGKTLKDWGGKKHLMHPRGAALSDVWRDLPRRAISDGIIPADALERLVNLTGVDQQAMLHLVSEAGGLQRADAGQAVSVTATHSAEPGCGENLERLETNQVYQGDCVAFLRRISVLHPEGVFDLAFADPPYNLQKGYDRYADALAEQHYLEWCNAWLEGMARALKPGGSLLVLNLPKWTIHHAAFLNRHLEFRHWIAWDALSDPRGKLMPAHYGLLYYTKPGGKPVFNYSRASGRPGKDLVAPPDSPKYCLRASCVNGRKAMGEDEKVELSDIWFDIHRIRHKRDRDAHPCQLPEKLLERIIKLTTRRGGVVFDPFCGAGTTAIAAAKLDRQFVVVDLDENYVRLSREKLAALKQNADLFGTLQVPRGSVARPRAANSKRAIELYLQTLARRLGRLPTEEDVKTDQPEILRQIDETYATRGAAFKRARIVLDQRAMAWGEQAASLQRNDL